MARGGARGFFGGFRGGAKHFFGALRGGANLFFCPPDVVFISDDHVINATSLSTSINSVILNDSRTILKTRTEQVEPIFVLSVG